MKKNVAAQMIGAQMVSSADGSAFTGAVAVAVTGDGGTQAVGSVGSGACIHEGSGFHSYVPAQAETNFDHIAFTFTGTGAVPTTIQVYTQFPQIGDAFARLGAPAGASIAADIATVDAVADAILVDTDASIPDLISSLNVPTAAVISDAVWDEARSEHTDGGSFGEAYAPVISGIVETATTPATTTSFAASNITEATADHFIGRTIIFLTGVLLGQASDITDYSLVFGEGIFTVTALTEAPADADRFVVL